jgi:hypothetical protein
MAKEEINGKYTKATGLFVTALIGGVVSVLVAAILTSEHPYNLIAYLYLLFFILFIIIAMGTFYVFVDWSKSRVKI